MQSENAAGPRPDVKLRNGRPPSLSMAASYFLMAIGGLIGTWYFNLRYTGDDYVGAWFANPASSSAAVDLLVLLLMAIVFYVREGARLGWPWLFNLLFVPLSIFLALAFALPLFLGLRELHLAREHSQHHGER